MLRDPRIETVTLDPMPATRKLVLQSFLDAHTTAGRKKGVTDERPYL